MLSYSEYMPAQFILALITGKLIRFLSVDYLLWEMCEHTKFETFCSKSIQILIYCVNNELHRLLGGLIYKNYNRYTFLI